MVNLQEIITKYRNRIKKCTIMTKNLPKANKNQLIFTNIKNKIKKINNIRDKQEGKRRYS